MYIFKIFIIYCFDLYIFCKFNYKKEDWKYFIELEIERIVLINFYFKIEFLKLKMKENLYNCYFYVKLIKFLVINVNECDKLWFFSLKYLYYWFFKNGLYNFCELNFWKYFIFKFIFIFVNFVLNIMFY